MIIMLIGGFIAIIPLANLIIDGIQNLKISLHSQLTLAELGQLGDFFGGHTSAFAGSLSLIIVIFFTFHQARQQHEFFVIQQADSIKIGDRQFFLDGINLITQWDIKSSGCDQCMRLLDYYGRIAIKSSDSELLLILNTVITAKIRANLQNKNGSFRATNYPYACEAMEKIGKLREIEMRGWKAERQRSGKSH